MKERTVPKVTINEWKGLIKSYIVRFITVLLFWLPVKVNRIMIYNHDRKGFSCNPKYLALALQEKYGDRVEIFWVSQYPETCEEVEKLGIPVILANSAEHIKKYITTKVYITNDFFPHWARHRHGQLWLNAWHGAINYKHIGYDHLPVMNFAGRKLFRLKNRKPDLFLAGSQFFAKDTAESFRMTLDIFLYSGLPRNDIFFQEEAAVRQRVRDGLNISTEAKIVLYAPTFRNGEHSSTYGIDFVQLQAALHDRFGGKWIVLFRNHNFVKESENNLADAIDVSDYPDMQELLLAADALISDYSSCMWDFSLRRRPCFIYAPDFKDYQNSDRDFAFPVSGWPYPMAVTGEELADNIRLFDEEVYLGKLKQHHEEAGRLDWGTASRQTLEKIHMAAGWDRL